MLCRFFYAYTYGTGKGANVGYKTDISGKPAPNLRDRRDQRQVAAGILYAGKPASTLREGIEPSSDG